MNKNYWSAARRMCASKKCFVNLHLKITEEVFWTILKKMIAKRIISSLQQRVLGKPLEKSVNIMTISRGRKRMPHEGGKGNQKAHSNGGYWEPLEK